MSFMFSKTKTFSISYCLCIFSWGCVRGFGHQVVLELVGVFMHSLPASENTFNFGDFFL